MPAYPQARLISNENTSTPRSTLTRRESSARELSFRRVQTPSEPIGECHPPSRRSRLKDRAGLISFKAGMIHES